MLEEGARKAGLQKLAAWTAEFDLGAALWLRLPDSAQPALDEATMTMVGPTRRGTTCQGSDAAAPWQRLGEPRLLDSEATVLERRGVASG